jgi:hypothetical protein
MLYEVVQPYLDDLERRARIGAVQAAREIGLGVLMGLLRRRDEDDNDRVSPMRACLTPSTISVRRRSRPLKNAGLDVSDDWLGDTCRAWAR